MYANLMVSMAQVDGAENGCLTQPVKQVSNTRYGEYIEPSLTVRGSAPALALAAGITHRG